ncbi:hypothetical protein FKM82_016731 [Ascaphus truei]
MAEPSWRRDPVAYEGLGVQSRLLPFRSTEGLRSSWHERLARLDSGGSSLSSTDSTSDRAAVRVSAYTRRENRLASLGSKTEEEAEKDFKKLYESAFCENEKLKTNLRDAQLELADIKSKLERVVKGLHSDFPCFAEAGQVIESGWASGGREKGEASVGAQDV